jgi:hypothetical protein
VNLEDGKTVKNGGFHTVQTVRKKKFFNLALQYHVNQCLTFLNLADEHHLPVRMLEKKLH